MAHNAHRYTTQQIWMQKEKKKIKLGANRLLLCGRWPYNICHCAASSSLSNRLTQRQCINELMSCVFLCAVGRVVMYCCCCRCCCYYLSICYYVYLFYVIHLLVRCCNCGLFVSLDLSCFLCFHRIHLETERWKRECQPERMNISECVCSDVNCVRALICTKEKWDHSGAVVRQMRSVSNSMWSRDDDYAKRNIYPLCVCMRVVCVCVLASLAPVKWIAYSECVFGV